MKHKSFVAPILLFAAAALVYSFGPFRSAAEAEITPELIVYWDSDFKGHSLRVTGNLLDMPKEVDRDWNDAISSIQVVKGTWRLCQNGRFNTTLDDTPVGNLDVASRPKENGWSTIVSANSLGPVTFSGKNGMWAEDEISSIELVSAENLPDWAAGTSTSSN